jgi:GDP-4-dehydro-6-deoxy-D-mannose reductase
MKKVLITGMTGMIGSHFVNACTSKGWETYGVARNSASSRLATLPIQNLITCDIIGYHEIENVVRKVSPDIVIHMAAQAFNGTSWNAEDITHLTNYQGTLNVLRSCKQIVPNAKILLACSSAEYGNVRPDECPIVEERLLQPFSPYGVSKVGVECLGFQYFSNYGMAIYLPRLFIHVGTGHPPATAIQNFARQLALISKGKAEPIIRVGSLETSRDFIDVRDGVNGMMLLLESGKSGIPINICTGTAHKISDVLRILVEISGLDVKVLQDPGLLRPSDEPLLLGDNSRLRALGWKQKVTIEQTLQAVYENWLSRI